MVRRAEDASPTARDEVFLTNQPRWFFAITQAENIIDICYM